MDAQRSRGIVARMRRRMLLAIGAGVAPLPRAAASARLPALAERFAAGDELHDAEGAALFAALVADPELAEAFELVASATAATGAARPSSALARRLATIVEAPAIVPAVPSGRAVAVARALAAWRVGGADALAVVLRGGVVPPAPGVATADSGAYLALREAGAAYDARPPADVLAVSLVVAARGGATVAVALRVEGHPGAYHLRVSLRDPASGVPPERPWRIAARVGRRVLSGVFAEPGEWAAARALTEDEFARVTVTLREG